MYVLYRCPMFGYMVAGPDALQYNRMASCEAEIHVKIGL